MQLRTLRAVEDLLPLQYIWNELAGSNPHLRFEWLVTWWNHYHRGAALYVLCCESGGSIVGIAPFYVEHRGDRRIVQFLGSGKACSDHLSIMCSPMHRRDVVSCIVGHLLDNADAQWTDIELVGADAMDSTMQLFTEMLADCGLQVHTRPGTACYSVDLSNGWDAYLARRSKSTRRKLRRQVERCEAEGFEVTWIREAEQFKRYWPVFADLHVKRRADQGTNNCFDDSQFIDFLYDACLRMMSADRMALVILTCNDRPAAAELVLESRETTFYYQSGMDPDLAHVAPGLMLLAHTAVKTCHRGGHELDFLRGGRRIQT